MLTNPTTAAVLPAQANAAQLLWNSTGSAVLVMTAADVDATNQSYYGEQKLFFMSADGTNECQVPLPKVRLSSSWGWPQHCGRVLGLRYCCARAAGTVCVCEICGLSEHCV